MPLTRVGIEARSAEREKRCGFAGRILTISPAGLLVKGSSPPPLRDCITKSMFDCETSAWQNTSNGPFSSQGQNNVSRACRNCTEPVEACCQGQSRPGTAG